MAVFKVLYVVWTGHPFYEDANNTVDTLILPIFLDISMEEGMEVSNALVRGS